MDKQINQFLDEAAEQISYKPLRPSIRLELESHILDRVDEYEERGISRFEAEQKAIHDMGDAITIGTKLNEVHQLQKAPGLLILSTLLLLIGLAFAIYTQELGYSVHGLLYYIPGIILFFLTCWKGYPIFICHWKKIAVLVGFLYLMQIIIFSITHNGRFLAGTASTAYSATLLYSLVIAFLTYRFRQNKRELLSILFGCIGVWFLYTQYCYLYTIETSQTIFLLCTFTTLCFMIHREILIGNRRKLYLAATGFLFFVGVIIFHNPLGYSRDSIQTFLNPQSAATSALDDSYNNILIQELLKRTPLTGALELSPEELMEYGTGSWYFASRDPNQINHTTASASIRYSGENFTLWNILPLHFRNNYLIAVCIIMFGWLPGLLLLGCIGLFYVFLFFCIRKIHGKPAASLAFCSGQCLLWQTCFYILGNFGYQYATFPNLPLLAEGRISILFNLMLLGFIYSAYRYDHVIEETM